MLLLLACLILVTFSFSFASQPTVIETEAANVHGFPKDFSFGASTAAYQIEGGWKADGKGPSIWDTLTHEHPELVADHLTGDVAADSYHFYKKDVAALKQVGVTKIHFHFKLSLTHSVCCLNQFQHYRFSISWSRIFPFDTKVNHDAFDYYNRLIEELIVNGIEPVKMKRVIRVDAIKIRLL